MNDPLGLFEEDINSDPLGLFAEEEESWTDKAKGVGEAALNLGSNMLLTPIAGFRGLGKLATGASLEDAVKGVEGVQEEAYRPRGSTGQRYAENAANVLNYIPEKVADFGEYVGGNEGRLVGEIAGEFATDLIPFGLIAKGVSRKPKASSKLDAIRSEQGGLEVDIKMPDGTTDVGRAYKPNDGLDGQGNLFEPEVEGRGISPYEATSGDWRVDENGMPIRVDLSLELQNLQQPLQRNLWGDELDPGDFGRDPNAPLPMDRDIMGYPKMSENVVNRTDPEAAIPLTEAIDSMPWAQKRGALKKTKLGREMEASGELEAAKMEADGPKGFNVAMQKQRGAIDPDVFLKDFPEFVSSVIKDAGGKLKALYRGVQSDYDGAERPMAGTLGEGIYLTESKTLANNYAKNRQGETGGLVKAAYVDMKRPFEIEMGSPEHRGLLLGDKASRKQFSDTLKAQGFDGVVVKNGTELKEVMAFSPNQVQNAFSTPPSRIPRSQRGGVLFEFSGKKKQTTNQQDIDAVKKQIDDLGRRFVDGSIPFEEFSKTNHELIGKKIQMESLERQRLQNMPADQITEIYPGYNIIPVGTFIMAKHGTQYSEPTRGKVVGTKQFRYGSEAYNLPKVDFGDGRPRAILPGDILEVFGGPKTPNAFKSQRGALLIDPKELNKIENSLAASQDGSFIPENPNVEKVIEKALTEKDSKIWTYTQSGSTSAAMKSGSSIIKAVSEIVQNAAKRADLLIRQTIFPAEKALQKLSRKEITELGELMKDEMFKGKRYDGEVLAKHLSIKQLEAYANMRELFDKALDTQNAARLSQGKEPISPNEAYMASRWQGDFRQPVYDKDGKLVWYLAAHTKAGLNAQIKELNKIKPGLVIDPAKAHTVRSSGKTDLQSAYTTLLDLLGRDDPAVAQIKQIIEEQTLSEGAMALAQEKHFEKKGNIRGFVGDRPGKGGTKEALAMFAQQIQYAKNAYKWSELQKAAEDVAAIVKNPELQQAQPNNIKYVREYFKNAIGMNEARVVNALNDTIREGLGFSPTLINNAVGNMKSFFITQKLIISMGYMASNVLQSANVLPYLADLRVQGIKGDPISAVSVGVLASLPMTISHYIGGAGMSYVDSLPNQFLKDAFRYAEDNGVTARSVYDEAPVEGSFNPVMNYVVNPAQRITNAAETLTRSIAFMTFAQFLKSSGKYTDQSKLFQKAEELTNMAMVDYRESERPMMFSKAGAAGNLANTLQTFPVSFYNQYGYMLKQAMKGGVAGALPLATMLAVHYGMAGMMGIPGFDDADKLYKWLRDNALPDSAWNEVSKSPFFSDPKMWVLDNWGQGAMYGALSDKTGIGMTSRVAAPGAGAMTQAPLGPVIDIAGQVGAVAKAVGDPTNTTKWGQAAMKVAPVGLQGLLETAPFMKDITYVERPDGSKVYMRASDLADRKGGYERTPEETTVRKFGVRSQKEVLTRDVAYSTALANQTLNKKTGEIVDKYYDAIRRGDTKKVKELATLYTDVSGKEITNQALENQIKEEWFSDIEKQQTRNGTARQLMNAAKMQKLLESK